MTLSMNFMTSYVFWALMIINHRFLYPEYEILEKRGYKQIIYVHGINFIFLCYELMSYTHCNYQTKLKKFIWCVVIGIIYSLNNAFYYETYKSYEYPFY